MTSCSEETTEDKIIGRWVYERETFNSLSTFEDPDVSGIIQFDADETALYESSTESRDLEWDLQSMDTRIALTRSFTLANESLLWATRVYDLDIKNDTELILNYTTELGATSDTVEAVLVFENLILTRIE